MVKAPKTRSARAAKATPARVRARRTGTRPSERPAQSKWVLFAAAAAVLLAVAAVVWAVNRGVEDTPAPVSIDHVHGLGVNPTDGVLYAAAHNGVFRLPADGPASRVGDGQQDTMGFTVTGPNHFLASGHPSHEEGGPPHLGLIESTDGGVTWKTLSLQGGADFHALRYRHDTVYGYNSTNGALMVSRDGASWESRATIALRDFAVSPSSPETLLATTQTGLVSSTDGGRTWAGAGGPPVLLLDWEPEGRLWALTAAGEVLRSADAGTTWTSTGRIAGAPTAFAATGDDLYVSVNERGIFHSSDAGTTWTQRHP